MLLRPADPSDALAVAGVHVRSWQVAYRGLLPDDCLATLRAEDRAEHYNFGDPHPEAPWTIVAVQNDAICAFATSAPSRDADAPASGELLALYVDPSRWSEGIGRSLVAAARKQLAQRGFVDAILWVLVGNERASHFYQADGWTADGSRRLDEVWGVAVSEERYRRGLL